MGRREANRAALVAAVRSRLLAEGLAGLNFERIAETAGMTRKSVYNHFGSRAGLMEALMDDIGQRAGFKGMAEVWAHQDPKQLLEAYYQELCRGWEADRDMFRLMIGLSAADQELGAAVLSRVERVRKGVDALVDRLAAAPGMKLGWSPESARACLFGLSVFTTFDAIRRAGMEPDETALRLAQMARAPFSFSG